MSDLNLFYVFSFDQLCYLGARSASLPSYYDEDRFTKTRREYTISAQVSFKYLYLSILNAGMSISVQSIHWDGHHCQTYYI